MNITLETLDLLGYQLVLIRPGEKAPVRKRWTEQDEPLGDIEKALANNPALGVGVKLGGPSGIIDIEGDGPGADRVWNDLSNGHDVSGTASWASERGIHRLFTLTPETRAIVGERTIKSGDLEIRLGQADRYTLQSVTPIGCQTRKWVSGTPAVLDLPVELARRIAAIREGQPAPPPDKPPVSPLPAPPPERPGDFFNCAANWEEILAVDGWTPVGSRKDGTTDWLRPGHDGSQKLSATVNYHGDNKLYMFSAGHPELEAENSYTPFAYIAEVYHGGDFKQAAAWCREQGYCPKVEVSDPLGVFTEAAEEEHIESIPHIPTELLMAPGFIQDFAVFHAKNSHLYNLRAGAIGGWMLQAWLMGRKVRLDDDTRSNLACLWLAPSGTGKTELIKSMKIVLARLGQLDAFSSAFKSWQSFEDNLAEQPNMLLVQEEIQDQIKALNIGRDVRQLELAEHTKTMLTEADGTYQCRKGLKVDKQTEGVSIIDQPSLSMLCTGIPEETWSTISTKQLNDGYWARFWIIGSPDLPPQNPKKHIDETLLASLVERAKSWRGLQVDHEIPPVALPVEDGQEPQQQEGRLIPRTIERTDGSAKLSEEYTLEAHARRCRNWGKEDDDTQSSLQRVAEVLHRFELILAGSKGVMNCKVDAEITRHAIELVEASMKFKKHRIETRDPEKTPRDEWSSRMHRYFKFRDQRGKNSVGWREMQMGLRSVNGVNFNNAVIDLTAAGSICHDGIMHPEGLRFNTRPNKLCLAQHAHRVFKGKKPLVLQS